MARDIMKTGDAVYEAEADASLSNFSVMAEGEYALALNDTFSVYGSLGLGAVGVATLWLSVSCSESITRRISLKLRPVLAG